MSDLLEALERAEQALRDIEEGEGVMSPVFLDAEWARKKMKYHLRVLKEYLKLQEGKRLQEWNRLFQYRPNHQEEMRIP